MKISDLLYTTSSCALCPLPLINMRTGFVPNRSASSLFKYRSKTNLYQPQPSFVPTSHDSCNTTMSPYLLSSSARAAPSIRYPQLHPSPIINSAPRHIRPYRHGSRSKGTKSSVKPIVKDNLTSRTSDTKFPDTPFLTLSREILHVPWGNILYVPL
jgi:hypothetical protein